MLGLNGGLIGARRSPTAAAAVGLWTPNEQVISRRLKLWPFAEDLNWSSVSLLLPMDGSNGSTTFSDASNNALAVTANGNAQISTAQSKFSGASAYFDGTGDYLSVASSAANAAGTGAFTWEAWIYPTAATTFHSIISTRTAAGTANGLTLGMDAGRKLYLYSDGFILNPATQVSLNTWSYVAAKRSGTTIELILNDTSLGTTTNSQNFSNQTLSIGSVVGGAEQSYTGYVDSTRLTTGIARTITAAPTAAFPYP